MEGSAFIESSILTYINYCVTFCLRYFAVAGVSYWLFQVGFRQRWLAYRIRETFPPLQQVGYEIRWSMLNTACTGLSTVVLYQLIHAGWTSMYFDVADHGIPYFCFSALLGVVGYDAWFYWQHRLLHTSWLFQHVHAIHHRAVNPTAFAAYALHPIETFMGNAYFILFVAFVPVHPLAFGALGLYLFLCAMIAHMGYEFCPPGFTRHRVFRWSGTSTHHNMHHRHVGCNYGICFNYWDRLMGTNHPAYHDTFEAIKARGHALLARGHALPTSSAGGRTAANAPADRGTAVPAPSQAIAWRAEP